MFEHLNVEHVECRETDTSQKIQCLPNAQQPHTMDWGCDVVKSRIKRKKRRTCCKTSNGPMEVYPPTKVMEAASSRSWV